MVTLASMPVVLSFLHGLAEGIDRRRRRRARLAGAGAGDRLPRAGQARCCARNLWFGRNIGGKLGVTEKLWRQFVARELTPRFPDGLTVVEAHGQWRDSKSGARVREPSKIVVLVTADDAATRERIAAAADAYKKRFKQDSVATVTRPVCAAF